MGSSRNIWQWRSDGTFSMLVHSNGIGSVGSVGSVGKKCIFSP
ncbi:MAG: hypothetical protein QNJ74_07815 [Trichodesmium sp. MO_231.B1]|nr:hypothetical protein [Trichodesmium sp. MO_231.B1]